MNVWLSIWAIILHGLLAQGTLPIGSVGTGTPTCTSPNGFTTCFTIVTDPTQAGTADTATYPLLVSITKTALKTTGNGGSMTNSSGFDRWYTSDIGCTTKIAWESIQYGASTGAIVDFVQIGTLSHTVATTVYLCVGKAAITTDQSNKTGTWPARYQLVAHLQEASNPYNDSTTHARNSSSGTYPTQVSGLFGQAQSFNSASSQYIRYPVICDTTCFQAGNGNTWSVWFKVANGYTPGANRVVWDTRINNASGQVMYLDSTGGINAFCSGASGSVGPFSGTNDGNWHYLVVNAINQSPTTWAFIIDNTSHASGSNCTSPFDGTVGENVGADYTNTGNSYITGTIQEVRESSAPSSTSQITADYNSQKSGSTFITVTP